MHHSYTSTFYTLEHTMNSRRRSKQVVFIDSPSAPKKSH